MKKQIVCILFFAPFYTFSQYNVLTITEKPKEKTVLVYDTLQNIKVLKKIRSTFMFAFDP